MSIQIPTLRIMLNLNQIKYLVMIILEMISFGNEHMPMEVLGNTVLYTFDPYDVAKNADTLVLCTEWDEFNEINWMEMKSVMRGCAFVDGRNMFDGKTMESIGFKYTGVGV